MAYKATRDTAFLVALLFQPSFTHSKYLFLLHRMWSIQLVDIKAIDDIIKRNLNRFHTLEEVYYVSY